MNINKINRSIIIFVSFILIFTPIQLGLLNPHLSANVTGVSSWTQNLRHEFLKGITDNTTITPSGEIQLTHYSDYIMDNFTDESEIESKEKIWLDDDANEIKLNKIYKLFGGINRDWSWSVEQTSDNGCIIAGYTDSFGSGKSDAWIIKTDHYGNETWNSYFGGSKNDWAYSVQEAGDGGYIVTGYTESYGAGNKDIWLIKIDSNGKKVWDKTYGEEFEDKGFSVLQTSENGYLILGSKQSNYMDTTDIWLIKTDLYGNEQWNKTYGGSGDELGYSIQETTDKGYIIVGWTQSYGSGNADIWLLKVNHTGIEKWSRPFGGLNNEFGNSVQQTSDNGYIITGLTHSFGKGNTDLWLIKTNKSGAEQWNKTYGGSGYDTGNDIQITIDEGYIIIGETNSYGVSGLDIWLIKTDANGNQIWEKRYGGNDVDRGESVQTSDNGYILTGVTNSFSKSKEEIFIIKTDNSGNIPSEGYFISTNIIEGHNYSSLIHLDTEAVAPENTKITVQFSQNKLNWYDSYGAKDNKEILRDGLNNIDLSGLTWNGSSFYYKIVLTSIDIYLPSLKSINLTYNLYCNLGTFESKPFDSGGNITWKTIQWNSVVQSQTKIKFQLKTANSQINLSLMEYTGPEGTVLSYYDIPGEAITFSKDTRWIQYKALFFTNDTSKSPRLNNVSINYNYIPSEPGLNEPINDIWISNNTPEFTWKYMDKDSKEQWGFQWQIDNSSDFSSINYDSGIILSNITSYKHNIKFEDGIWYWRVRTKDYSDDWGPYSDYYTLKIDTISPEINHNPITNITESEDIIISVEAIDDRSGIDEVFVYFKNLSSNEYNKIKMNGSEDYYSTIINATDISTEGIEYYIGASDNSKPNNARYFGKNGETKTRPTSLIDIDISIEIEDENDVIPNNNETVNETKPYEQQVQWHYIVIVVIIIVALILFFLFIKSRIGGKERPEEQNKEEPPRPAESVQKPYGSQQDQYQSIYGDTPQQPPPPPPQQ